MIDTTLLIEYFRKTDKSKSRLFQLSQQFDQIFISAVTEFEVYIGATPTQLTSHIAVEIQRDLKKLRKTIEKADLFIAATSVANGLTLDTLNRKHFDKIKRLTLLDENIEG